MSPKKFPKTVHFFSGKQGGISGYFCTLCLIFDALPQKVRCNLREFYKFPGGSPMRKSPLFFVENFVNLEKRLKIAHV